MKPLACAAIDAIRAGVDVGATRNIRSISCARISCVQLARLFRRQVDDDDSVDAGLRRRADELSISHAFDRIQIAHQHASASSVACAKFARPCRVCRASFVPAANARSELRLYRRAFGLGIRKRHADLEHVGAAIHERMQRRNGRGRSGSPPVMNVTSALRSRARRSRPSATRDDSQLYPVERCNRHMSLSPRPDRFTMMISSRGAARRVLLDPRKRMARFERGHDAFDASQVPERSERSIVGDRNVVARVRYPSDTNAPDPRPDNRDPPKSNASR